MVKMIDAREGRTELHNKQRSGAYHKEYHRSHPIEKHRSGHLLHLVKLCRQGQVECNLASSCRSELPLHALHRHSTQEELRVQTTFLRAVLCRTHSTHPLKPAFLSLVLAGTAISNHTRTRLWMRISCRPLSARFVLVLRQEKSGC